ncbi:MULTISPECIES: DUF917 domain-containing protein [unclassified Halanaerobium]|uniref:DUF917 domain-containing protein n=1 Tax=unclassified Halanaerobium TaxID=2641197 RepID=UPI000DF3C8A6|nr:MULTISPECIES: DUF917 domain-containing protein [unclassified Halanaerobium]RCW40666.1 hypothetical protein DFR78_1423 [Halanaerobium sp. MA284_MarDTE_T2]RCW78940.1 hypothetical protein DER71_14511 [Halanaerobium sp. DL-01]
MSDLILKTKTEVEDFVRGCTFFGTGGGGLPENGIVSIMSELNKGKEIKLVSPDQIEDDAVVATPFLMGSIAPKTDKIKKEMKKFGLENSVNDEKQMLAKALKELENYMDKKIDYVVPIELGGSNAPGAIAAGISNNMQALDGDYVGRAIPEILQTTPALDNKKIWPISSVDEWGNVSIIKDSINFRIVERIGKLISAAAYGLAGQAGFILSGKEMKKYIVKNSLSKCYKVGKLIRESDNPISSLIDELNGWKLGKGKITKLDDEDKDGYYWGTTHIKGTDKFKNDEFKIWFKNENHICYKNDKVIATSPDIIVLLNTDTGEPVTNGELNIGDSVTIIGVKGNDKFRTEKGIKVLGPKYFGFEDIDYTEIEKLN